MLCKQLLLLIRQRQRRKVWGGRAGLGLGKDISCSCPEKQDIAGIVFAVRLFKHDFCQIIIKVKRTKK